MQDLPQTVDTAEQLDELLSRPSCQLIGLLRTLDGDVMILGAGGKIGPSMARMAQRAVQQAGADKRVYAVDVAPLPALAAAGLTTLTCDMLDLAAIQRLPRAKNIVFMAGRKFGSTGGEHLTWAVNVVVPYHVARTFTDSRIVAFSTGCVYPLADVHGGGSTELTPPEPVGEYAMSCLGRERMFEYYSRTQGEQVLQFRLNYAVELRYGVLVDVATKVFRGEELDVTTGYANILWQGDVCNQALLCLGQAASPPAVLNVTGPETFSIREVAHQFGRLFGKAPRIVGTENGRGYLSNAARAKDLFGPPSVPMDVLIRWIAHWIQAGGENLGKPTHFEAQDGKY